MITEEDSISKPVTNKGSTFFELPRTRLGRWSAVLGAICLFLLALTGTGLLIHLPQEPWWASRLAVLPVVGLTMILSGLSAGVTGCIAALRHHERSFLVCIFPIGMGFLIALLVFAQLVSGE